MRELLIDAILDLSGDEYEEVSDVIELAIESEEQLVKRIVAVAAFYRDQYNECC